MIDLATVVVWDITGSTKWLIHRKQGIEELIECLRDMCQQAERFGFGLSVPRGDGAILIRKDICPEQAVVASRAMYAVFDQKYRGKGFLRVAISGGKVVYATIDENLPVMPFGVPIHQACRLCDWSPRDGHVVVISRNFLLGARRVLGNVDSDRVIELPMFPEPYDMGYCFTLN